MTSISPSVRNGRIIVMVMIGGLLFFTGVVIWLAPHNKPDMSKDTGLYMLGALAVLMLGSLTSGGTVRRSLVGQVRRSAANSDGDARQRLIANGYLNLTVVAASLAEGPALFGVVIVFLTGQWLALIATSICTLFLLRALPTAQGLEQFARDVDGPPASGGNTLRS